MSLQQRVVAVVVWPDFQIFFRTLAVQPIRYNPGSSLS
jgi:hypothetical protein